MTLCSEARFELHLRSDGQEGHLAEFIFFNKKTRQTRAIAAESKELVISVTTYFEDLNFSSKLHSIIEAIEGSITVR